MKTKHTTKHIALAILLLLITFNLSGQIKSSVKTPEGDWSGIVRVQDKEFRINLYIRREGEAYTSTYDSPDQGTFGKKSTKTTFLYPDFSFSNEQSGFEVLGKIDSNYQRIKGQMFQRDLVFSVDLRRKTGATAEGKPADQVEKR